MDLTRINELRKDMDEIYFRLLKLKGPEFDEAVKEFEVVALAVMEEAGRIHQIAAQQTDY